MTSCENILKITRIKFFLCGISMGHDDGNDKHVFELHVLLYMFVFCMFDLYTCGIQMCAIFQNVFIKNL